MSKDSRSGGKFTGNHTTLIPAARVVCDVANACPSVTKITPGFIKGGLRPVNGQRRVKIIERGRALLLSIRDNASHQEVYVYTNDMRATKLAIARGSISAGLGIAFGEG